MHGGRKRRREGGREGRGIGIKSRLQRIAVFRSVMVSKEGRGEKGEGNILSVGCRPVSVREREIE